MQINKMPNAKLYIQNRRLSANENVPDNQIITFNLFKYFSGGIGLELVGKSQIYNIELDKENASIMAQELIKMISKDVL